MKVASHDAFSLLHDAYGYTRGTTNETMVHQKSSIGNYQNVSASCELKFY